MIAAETISQSEVSSAEKSTETVFRNLHQYLTINNYKGWEYDDLLASPVVNSLTLGMLYPKIAAVQVSKRSPFNLRKILGVPKLMSTKAWGFIVKGYLYHDLANNSDEFRSKVEFGLDWLIENISTGYKGACWGNDFDFASRAGYFPKGLPTIVWTSHIQESFELAYRITGEQKYLDVVTSVADFILNDLARIKGKNGFCFAYAPGIDFPIHNSNLLGAAALARSYKYTGKEIEKELALESCQWSIERQNPDGSWYYGDKEMLHWIDNYHTAYNLDCLITVSDLTGNELEFSKVIESTFEYWTKNLFDQDHAPRFYNNSSYPRDIQATAQAIESLAKYETRKPGSLELARKTFEWASLNMLKDNGSFAYRIYSSGKRNNLEAIHWGQATMLSALGHLIYFNSKTKEPI